MLHHYGFDGQGRYQSPTQAYSKLVEILWGHGIDILGIVDSFLLQQPKNNFPIRLAFVNPDNTDETKEIDNSAIRFTYYDLGITYEKSQLPYYIKSDSFEVLAYLT